MRFLALALVPRGTPDIQAAIARLVAPYDLSLPAPPYKKYLSEQAIKGHASRFGIPVTDLQALVARINEQHSLHLLADARGIYAMVDTNPIGKYKRWSLNSVADDAWPVSAMPRDLVPHAVITPDGQWHELFPNIWGKLPTAQEKQRIAREAYSLVDQYPDHLAARLECHF